MDALMFEVVLVNATPAVHDQVVRALPITPITRGKRWRLYRVVRLH
jgi:hypothetical protein